MPGPTRIFSDQRPAVSYTSNRLLQQSRTSSRDSSPTSILLLNTPQSFQEQQHRMTAYTSQIRSSSATQTSTRSIQPVESIHASPQAIAYMHQQQQLMINMKQTQNPNYGLSSQSPSNSGTPRVVATRISLCSNNAQQPPQIQKENYMSVPTTSTQQQQFVLTRQNSPCSTSNNNNNNSSENGNQNYTLHPEQISLNNNNNNVLRNSSRPSSAQQKPPTRRIFSDSPSSLKYSHPIVGTTTTTIGNTSYSCTTQRCGDAEFSQLNDTQQQLKSTGRQFENQQQEQPFEHPEERGVSSNMKQQNEEGKLATEELLHFEFDTPEIIIDMKSQEVNKSKNHQRCSFEFGNSNIDYSKNPSSDETVSGAIGTIELSHDSIADSVLIIHEDNRNHNQLGKNLISNTVLNGLVNRLNTPQSYATSFIKPNKQYKSHLQPTSENQKQNIIVSQLQQQQLQQQLQQQQQQQEQYLMNQRCKFNFDETTIIRKEMYYQSQNSPRLSLSPSVNSSVILLTKPLTMTDLETELNEFRSANASLSVEVSALKSRESELQSLLEEMRSKNHQLIGENTQYAERVAGMEANFHAISSHVNEALARILPESPIEACFKWNEKVFSCAPEFDALSRLIKTMQDRIQILGNKYIHLLRQSKQQKTDQDDNQQRKSPNNEAEPPIKLSNILRPRSSLTTESNMLHGASSTRTNQLSTAGGKYSVDHRSELKTNVARTYNENVLLYQGTHAQMNQQIGRTQEQQHRTLAAHLEGRSSIGQMQQLKNMNQIAFSSRTSHSSATASNSRFTNRQPPHIVFQDDSEEYSRDNNSSYRPIIQR